MNDALAQTIDPVLRYVLHVRREAALGEHPPLVRVRADLVALFDEAGRQAAAAAETSAAFALARYALAYWADEVLIDSVWAHAEAWRDHILEWEYFRENVGGEKFYEKAGEAERLADTGPLEVFYLCVALGFQGRLRYAKAELQQWAERAYARVAAANQPPEKFLPDERPDDLGPIGPLPGKTLLLAVAVLLSATTLATLGGFIAAMHQY